MISKAHDNNIMSKKYHNGYYNNFKMSAKMMLIIVDT